MANKRPEPEIIPPDDAKREVKFAFHWAAGPPSLGSILVVLIAGILLAVFFILLLGTMLIWLPALILIITAVMVVGLVRAFFQGKP